MKEFARVLILLTAVLGGPALAQTEAPAEAPPAVSDPSVSEPSAAEPLGDARTDASDPAAPRPEDAPPITSFQRGSAQRAGGPANELNTRDARASEELPGGSAQDAIAGRDLYHGNYCGYGQRSAGLPATDELDAACKRHDECFDAAGRRSCACNASLRRDAVAVSNLASLSRELRARAASVAQAAELMECQQP